MLTAAVLIATAAPGPAQAASSVVYGGPISYGTVLARAAYWMRHHVPYSQDNSRSVYDVNHGRRYRTDCSGFVSMAWALDPGQLGRAPVTWEIPSYAGRITWRSLRAGDALLRLVPGDRSVEHVVLFERWADPGRARGWVLEESSSAAGVRRRLIDARRTALTGYVPYRYRRIV